MSGFGGSGLSYPQFPIESHRIGESVLLPFNGQQFTALNGSVWLAANEIPIPYTSAYSALLTDAPAMIQAGSVLGGPVGGRWPLYPLRRVVGATTPGATWLAMQGSQGTQQPSNYYFTSTDAGATWTRRTAPVAAKHWFPLWDGTNFVLYAVATAATGVQESTDGINWTPRTAISIATALEDFIYNGAVYLALQANGTAAATSADRTTWTSRTLAAATPSSTVYPCEMGNVTWNAAAALFIARAASTADYTYQTSPDGAAWIARTTLNRMAVGATTGFAFASSATRTVAIGQPPFFSYSDDGITWTDGLIDALASGGDLGSVAGLFHDGTRFVVVLTNGLVYYSTTGTAWTMATRTFLPAAAAAGQWSKLRVPTGLAAQSLNSMLLLSCPDVTSAANNLIVAEATSAALTADGTPRNYVRIK